MLQAYRPIHTAILVLCCFFVSNLIICQKFLQIEKINSTENIKISIGQKLVFKETIYSNEWQEGIIKDILYEDNCLLFDHSLVNLKDISAIKITNNSGKVFGYMLMSFGLAWLTYGAIIDLGNLNDQKALDYQNLVIGGLGVIGGFLLKSTSNKIYKQGKTHNFRILDLNMK